MSLSPVSLSRGHLGGRGVSLVEHPQGPGKPVRLAFQVRPGQRDLPLEVLLDLRLLAFAVGLEREHGDVQRQRGLEMVRPRLLDDDLLSTHQLLVIRAVQLAEDLAGLDHRAVGDEAEDRRGPPRAQPALTGQVETFQLATDLGVLG